MLDTPPAHRGKLTGAPRQVSRDNDDLEFLGSEEFDTTVNDFEGFTSYGSHKPSLQRGRLCYCLRTHFTESSTIAPVLVLLVAVRPLG
jgi:hypothetical protein